MEESADDRVSRKIVIVDDFDHNLDLPDSIKANGRPTIRGQHVRCSGDQLLLTGWKIPTREVVQEIDQNVSEGGVSDFVSKGTRYYLPEERIKTWESDVIDVKSTSNPKISSSSPGGNVKRPNLKNIYVSHNSIWTMDPDEPILEETVSEYDKKRRLFWIVFVVTTAAATLLLSCIYSWVFSFPVGNVPNATMDFLKEPKPQNKEYLRNSYDFHALIMTTAVFVNLGASTVIYRLFPHSSIFWVKCAHATLGAVGAVGSGAGLYFSFSGRNFKNRGTPFGVHATIGYISIFLIQVQFLFGFLFLMLPCTSFRLRVKIVPMHKFLGGFTFISSVTTVVTGIVVMAKILIPLDQHVKFPPRSIVLNLVGICAIVFAVLCTFLIVDHRFRRRSRPALIVTKEENITEFVNSRTGIQEDGEEESVGSKGDNLNRRINFGIK